MIKKMITVTTVQVHAPREYIFYEGMIIVNDDTHGVLFSGLADPDCPEGKVSKYLPFQIIKKVVIEDHDGGLVVCRSPRFLSIALDVSELKPVLEVIE